MTWWSVYAASNCRREVRILGISIMLSRKVRVRIFRTRCFNGIRYHSTKPWHFIDLKSKFVNVETNWINCSVAIQTWCASRGKSAASARASWWCTCIKQTSKRKPEHFISHHKFATSTQSHNVEQSKNGACAFASSWLQMNSECRCISVLFEPQADTLEISEPASENR